ncbi:uncharacterized protein M6B38_144325 [Iris pallida]|uniref:Uncharacterized protein n=1 Tax=Iris pallida TaxID=29817 RepID=A0AAX6FAT4_IRIPA|nr:uncharacterized protein M6B38_144325 [Iris pallida]
MSLWAELRGRSSKSEEPGEGSRERGSTDRSPPSSRGARWAENVGARAARARRRRREAICRRSAHRIPARAEPTDPELR